MNEGTLADLRRIDGEIGESPRLTPTGQSRLAYQLAALMLLLGVALQIGSDLVTPDLPGGINISAAIDFGLAVGLLLSRAGARNWVLFRAVLGAIVGPVIFFQLNDFSTAIFMIVAQVGFCGAIILLLTGQTKTWRMVLALALFVAFYFSINALGLLLLALNYLLQA